jgi:hypothetical protein
MSHSTHHAEENHQPLIGPPDWAVIAALLALFAGAVIGSRAAHAASQPGDWASWLEGLLQNVAAGTLGALLAFIAIEGTRRGRERRTTAEAGRALRQQIAEDMAAHLSAFVQGQILARLRAGRTPEERQPILDEMMAGGLLHGVDLRGANLQRARLQEADLAGANLEEASLPAANLRRADLSGATLQQADLQGADLQDANLRGANLHRANLRGANLQGANLSEAQFVTDRQLSQALKLWRATLPDGTRYDGRFELVADIQEARGLGVDSYNPDLMARWYAYPSQPYDGRALARWMRGEDAGPDDEADEGTVS